MHFVLKTAIVISITILLLSSAYTFVYKNDDINITITYKKNENNSDDSNEDYNENNSDNNSDENVDVKHYVFIEAGTTVCCKSCADVHVYLDEYYESDKYPFYYISLPIENEKAAEYLANYNIFGYPTIYFDGGFEVINGAIDWKNKFEEKILSSISRNIPKILVNVSGEWNKNNDEINIKVSLNNYEESVYSGRLKVYLTEIVSTKWQGDQPYKYAFIEFAINDDIEIPTDEGLTISKTIELSDLDYENLMIFAVVFNNEKQTGYSFPPDKNSFDAFYADAVDSTKIVKGGNLPPMIGISSPIIGYVHRFGNAIRVSNSGSTILLGRTTIIANVTDDSSIQKVEFYVNDKLMKTITKPPYEWKWHQFTIGKKTIIVKAYDEENKTSLAKMDVIAFIKWKNPILFLFEKLL